MRIWPRELDSGVSAFDTKRRPRFQIRSRGGATSLAARAHRCPQGWTLLRPRRVRHSTSFFQRCRQNQVFRNTIFQPYSETDLGIFPGLGTPRHEISRSGRPPHWSSRLQAAPAADASHIRLGRPASCSPVRSLMTGCRSACGRHRDCHRDCRFC